MPEYHNDMCDAATNDFFGLGMTGLHFTEIYSGKSSCVLQSNSPNMDGWFVASWFIVVFMCLACIKRNRRFIFCASGNTRRDL